MEQRAFTNAFRHSGFLGIILASLVLIVLAVLNILRWSAEPFAGYIDSGWPHRLQRLDGSSGKAERPDCTLEIGS